MAGINDTVNTLSIGPISHVSSALPQTLHLNDHVIIWMLTAVIAELHLPN